MFHENQIYAGDRVVDYFQSDEARYVLLHAPMQSGKSGTFNWVAKRMWEEGYIQQCYIICGSAERVLKEQTLMDRTAYGNGFINVRFRGDFPRLIRSGEEEFHNCLIIIDESHMDQERGQQMDQLFQSFHMSLDGDPEPLRRIGSYILSVSATPYSEYTNIIHGRNHKWKRIVDLEPGDGYRGVEWYYENNHIHPTFNILEHTERFVQIVKEHGNRYNILRFLDAGQRQSQSIERTIRTLMEENGFHIYEYNSKDKTIYLTERERVDAGIGRIIPTLEREPDTPSIVLIKGTLRAGKVLPKQYIGFVWEDSQNPLTDTVLQSLLGRVCGYHEYDIDVYISERVLYSNKGEFSELERYICDDMIPAHVRGVQSIRPLEENYRTHFTVPYKWVPDKPKFVKKREYPGWIQQILWDNYDEILEANPGYEEEIEAIIERTQEENNVSYRTFDGHTYCYTDNREDYVDILERAWRTDTPKRDIKFDRTREITVFVCVYPETDPRAITNGTVYIVFRMPRNDSDVQRIELEQFYPKSLGDDIFTPSMDKRTMKKTVRVKKSILKELSSPE